MIISKVFDVAPATWRGLGEIKGSGLKIKDKFKSLDAGKIFSLKDKKKDQVSRCRCADVLKGLISPDECPLFRKTCTPEKALGPCMVSIEGACNAYYKYR